MAVNSNLDLSQQYMDLVGAGQQMAVQAFALGVSVAQMPTAIAVAQMKLGVEVMKVVSGADE